MGWLGISLGLCQPRHSGGGTPTPTPSVGTAVIEQTSSTGANPILWRVLEDATFFDGYFWNVQTATGADTTAATANLLAGTTSADIIQEIAMGDLTGPGPITIAGLNTTSLPGPIALRVRVGVDDGAGGYTWAPWSNVLTDTLAATSTATLVGGVASTGAGVNKSQYIDVTGTPTLIATMNNVIGATCGVRTVTAPTGKRHFEVTINSVGTGGLIEIGLADSAFALGAAVFNPHAGSGSVAGCSLLFNGTATNAYANAGTTGGTTPALTTGDIIVVEFDTTANTVSFVHRRSGADTALASLTLTSNIPTNWTAYVAGATNAGSGDSVTVNFGATAFNKTPSSGYLLYG